jgi:Fe-S cluster assembly protein SufD
MKALQINNLPTPDQETWKYTNLPKAMPEGLMRAEDEEEDIIHIPRGQVRDKPVDILFTGVDNKMHVDQLKVIVEEGAEATIIERHDGQGAYWKNRVTEIDVHANAKLNHIRIQNDSIDAINTNMTTIQMDKDSTYDGFSLNLGGKLTRHEIDCFINGSNAECHFNGINLLKDHQHGDTTIVIEHKAPHCQSNQFYRSLLDDHARGVFQGKVHVYQEAQKTDGYQMSNAILLSKDAEMDTKPELEIYADDVKCSHGATTGQMDEGPLFYLRTRGLSEAEARFLLATAFIDEITAKIANESVRFEVERLSHTWLNQNLSLS